jgi:hypothetical protein
VNSPDDFDDDRELTNYVWAHYQNLMTTFELRAGRAANIAEYKARKAGTTKLADPFFRRFGAAGDDEVEAALVEGSEAFRRRVRDRLLAEHPAEVFVNRCPKCGRIVRTPIARQCFRCFFAWHHDNSVPVHVEVIADPVADPEDLSASSMYDRLAGIWRMLKRRVTLEEAIAMTAPYRGRRKSHRPPVGEDGDDPTALELRRLASGMEPGDELWYYDSEPEQWENLAGENGFAVVRGGRVFSFYMHMIN